MNRFSLKTEIISGSGSASVLETLKNERVMIIADPFIVSSGMLHLVTDHLSSCTVHIFSDVVPDPPLEKIAAGIVSMNTFHPTVIIACGGGSAIDSAKGIYLYGNRKQTDCSEISRASSSDACMKQKSHPCRFIAIPTTSGTGSEVTKFAVFTDAATGQKYPVTDDAMIPDMAVLDVDFVKTVPGKVTADTGMDVLTHAIEACVSVRADTLTDALAQKAVRLVFEYLERSYQSGGDLEARQKMHEASLLAGMAFNEASLGLNHAIAHNLGGRLHLAHGRINAMLLCPVIEYNAAISGYHPQHYSDAALKYAALASAAGVTAATPRQKIYGLLQKINRLMKALSLPMNFTQAKIDPAQVRSIADEAARGALADACMATTPRSASEADIKSIILHLL